MLPGASFAVLICEKHPSDTTMPLFSSSLCRIKHPVPKEFNKHARLSLLLWKVLLIFSSACFTQSFEMFSFCSLLVLLLALRFLAFLCLDLLFVRSQSARIHNKIVLTFFAPFFARITAKFWAFVGMKRNAKNGSVETMRICITRFAFFTWPLTKQLKTCLASTGQCIRKDTQ